MHGDAFKIALNAVLEQGTRTQVAVMCSESLWWRCHRRLIADAAWLLHGIAVQHIMHDGSRRSHVPTAGVRIDAAARRLIYDVMGEGP